MNEAWIPVHLSPNSSPLPSAVSHLMFLMSSLLLETQRAVLRSEPCSWSASMCNNWPCCWYLIEGIMVAFALSYSLWRQKYKALFLNKCWRPIGCAGMGALSWPAGTCGITTGCCSLVEWVWLSFPSLLFSVEQNSNLSSLNNWSWLSIQIWLKCSGETNRWTGNIIKGFPFTEPD